MIFYLQHLQQNILTTITRSEQAQGHSPTVIIDDLDSVRMSCSPQMIHRSANGFPTDGRIHSHKLANGKSEKIAS